MPTVKINDEELEVSLDAIKFNDAEVPTGFIPATKMQAEIQRRVAGAKRSARQELLDDSEFWTEVASARGLELREDGSVKGSSKDATAIEERILASKVAPLSEKLTAAEQQIERLRLRTLDASIVEAARAAGVRKSMLDPESPVAITKLVRDRFRHDAESDAFGLVDGDGFKYGTNGLAGPADLFASMKQDQQYADLFESGAMNGSGFGKAASGSTRTWTRAEIESMDAKTYEANADDIKAAYADGRITD